jgi:DNA polymerase III delta prime subunit
MSLYDKLWVEAYRPKKLEDLVLSDENRKFFSEITEDTPHLLLYGNQGTGKTTLAKIIVNDVLKCQYLYINASDENGIDTVRNKIINFSQTSSLDGKKKVIILDEADGLTDNALRSLRGVMEEYASTTRFILTANYINKIIDPIKSRCLMFKIQPDIQSCISRCCEILKTEKVTVSDEQKSNLLVFIEKNYPDLRRIINDLQKFSTTGSLIINFTDQVKNFAETVFNDLQTGTSSLKIRKKVIQEEKNFSSDYQNLMKEIFNLFYDSKLKDDKKKMILLQIGEHMYRDNSVMDHEINFYCCLIAIENVLT